VITARQLSLFGSKRQRGKAPPTPLEFALHCSIADVLRRWIMPGWKFTHVPAGEARPAVINKQGKRVSPAGERLKRMGLSEGWPDLMLLPPLRAEAPEVVPAVPPVVTAAPRLPVCPRAHFMEVKRKGRGRLSDAQDEFRTWCLLNGYPHAVVDTFEAAVEQLKQWGAVRSTVHVQ
jgi:hypothetical protein